MIDYIDLLEAEDVKDSILTRARALAKKQCCTSIVGSHLRDLRGGFEMGAVTLASLCDTLGCGAAYLLGLTDVKKISGYTPRSRDEMCKMMKSRLTQLAKEKKSIEDITFTHMALDMELSEQSLWGYREGYSLPRSMALARMSVYFQVSPDYLLGLTDERDIKHA